MVLLEKSRSEGDTRDAGGARERVDDVYGGESVGAQDPSGEGQVYGGDLHRFAVGPQGERRCTATSKRSGERCKRWSQSGSTVCAKHASTVQQSEREDLTPQGYGSVEPLGLTETGFYPWDDPAEPTLHELLCAFDDVEEPLSLDDIREFRTEYRRHYCEVSVSGRGSGTAGA